MLGVILGVIQWFSTRQSAFRTASGTAWNLRCALARSPYLPYTTNIVYVIARMGWGL